MRTKKTKGKSTYYHVKDNTLIQNISLKDFLSDIRTKGELTEYLADSTARAPTTDWKTYGDLRNINHRQCWYPRLAPHSQPWRGRHFACIACPNCSQWSITCCQFPRHRRLVVAFLHVSKLTDVHNLPFGKGQAEEENFCAEHIHQLRTKARFCTDRFSCSDRFRYVS